MLQIIRDKVTGWIAVAIVTLLIIPFALWGVNSYFEGGTNILAARVNGEAVSLQEYQRAYQNNRQRYQAENDNALLTNEQEDILKQQTIEDLVLRVVQAQTNTSSGMRVSDVLLGDTIRNLSYFQGIDGFDNALYESIVAQSGLTTGMFEEQMRDDLSSEQFRYALLGSAFLTDGEVKNIVRLLNQTRDTSYGIIAAGPFMDLAVFSDEELEEYYQQQTRQFVNPETVKISYVDLSLAKLAEDVVVDEDELLAYFDTYRANYEIEEQRSIRQVFIPTGEDAEEEQITRAREIAAAIHTNTSNDQTLDDAASEYLEDESLNIEISNLEFLTSGILDEEVDEVMFALDVSDISEPIENAAGVHIIQLTDITGGSSTAFEEIRDELEMDYRIDQSEARYAEMADEMTNLAFENPDTLEFIQEDLGLEVKETNYFSRDPSANTLDESTLEPLSDLVDYSRITSNPDVISTGFSDDVLINRNNSEPMQIEENRLIVIRVDDHRPETVKPFDEVKELITNRLKLQKATEDTREMGETIVDELRNDMNRDDLASQHGFEWVDASFITRNQADINPAILDAGFSAGTPSEDDPVYAGTSLPSGDYAVVIVHEILEEDTETLEEEELEAIKSQLGQQYTVASWNAYIRGLREQADVEVFDNNL